MLCHENSAAVAYAKFAKRDILAISQDDFQKLAHFIYKKTGILYREQKKYLLENRLSDRLIELGCKSYKEYLMYLQHDYSQKEFAKLTSILTNNETSFMRNFPQLLEYQTKVLPEVVKEAKSRPMSEIKIWSAGCSSGEEPYSLAILALEKFPILGMQKQPTIFATDLNKDMIAKAKNGVYRSLDIKKMPPQYLSKFFRKTEQGFKICEKVKSMVQFFCLNLVDFNRLKTMTHFDIIFFRNVMIYFGDEVRKKVVSCLYDSLRPGGFLFLGHSESLHGLSKAFKLLSVGRTMVYYKEKTHN